MTGCARMRGSLDRARLEAFLHGDELVSIAEWCRRRGVLLDSWPQHSATLCWVDLAIGRAVDLAITQGRARSHSAALRIVCAAFGLLGDSVRRRWERNRKTGDKVSLTSQKILVGCEPRTAGNLRGERTWRSKS